VTITLCYKLNRFSVFPVIQNVSVTIIVSVNGVDVFPLTGISVTVIVNGKNTESILRKYLQFFNGECYGP